MRLLEHIARAIAEENGDNFDDLPLAKWHWTEQRGQFGGRFRDVNEPFQSTYEAMANAAITAMRGYPTSAAACTCPEDWQGMDHTAGCKSRAAR